MTKPEDLTTKCSHNWCPGCGNIAIWAAFKKAAIDKMSDELRYARDFYGYTPVVVSQFNRDIANPMRLKNGDVEPQLEDFADSSQTQNDADVVLT